MSFVAIFTCYLVFLGLVGLIGWYTEQIHTKFKHIDICTELTAGKTVELSIILDYVFNELIIPLENRLILLSVNMDHISKLQEYEQRFKMTLYRLVQSLQNKNTRDIDIYTAELLNILAKLSSPSDETRIIFADSTNITSALYSVGFNVEAHKYRYIARTNEFNPQCAVRVVKQFLENNNIDYLKQYHQR